MRIQRGKEKRNHFAWISNRLVTCADIRQNPPDGTFFLPHCLTGMLQSLQNAAHTCRSVRQQLWTERSGPFFFASSRGLLISFFGTFWAVPGSFSGPSGTFCSWTSRSTRCPWRFRRGFVGGRWQGQRKPPRLAEQKWIGETEKLGNELSQIAIDNERYSTVYGLLPKSFKF